MNSFIYLSNISTKYVFFLCQFLCQTIFVCCRNAKQPFCSFQNLRQPRRPLLHLMMTATLQRDVSKTTSCNADSRDQCFQLSSTELDELSVSIQWYTSMTLPPNHFYQQCLPTQTYRCLWQGLAMKNILGRLVTIVEKSWLLASIRSVNIYFTKTSC